MRRLIAFLFLALLFTTCKKDPTTDAGDVGELVYGKDLTFSINADLSVGMPLDMNLPEGAVSLHIYGEEQNNIVSATHSVDDDCSTFTLDEPLLVGTHVICKVSYDSSSKADDDESSESVVLLSRILNVSETETSLSSTNMYKNTLSTNTGTEDDPIEIATSDYIVFLNMLQDASIKGTINYEFTTKGLYFKQTSNLDFKDYDSSSLEPFEGFCTDASHPFMGNYDGQGYAITNLEILRFTKETKDETVNVAIDPAGFFANISAASITNIVLKQPYIIGYDYVGALVGAVVCESGETQTYSYVSNCSVVTSASSYPCFYVYGRQYVGGLIGGVDNNAAVFIYNCSVGKTGENDEIAVRSDGSSYYVGGIIGGGYVDTEIQIQSCSNAMDITTSAVSSVGGLMGGGHYLSLSNSTNTGDIKASNALGVGGLVGGVLYSTAVASENSGDVTGKDHVGGIIGSTAISISDGKYGDVSGASLHNAGNITGSGYTGGLVGAAQARFIDSYNEGYIYSSSSSAGGLIGYAPVLIAFHSNNIGDVDATTNGGGLAGENYYTTYLSSNNMANVYGGSMAGGLVGSSGSVGSINYSNNYGVVDGGNSNYIGGIAGAIGLREDEHELDVLFIASVAVSSVCLIADIVGDVLKLGEEAEKILTNVLRGVETVKVIAVDTLEGIEMHSEHQEALEETEETESIIDEIALAFIGFDSNTYETEVQTACTDMSTKMETSVTAMKSIAYAGALSLGSSYNYALDCYNNSVDYATFASTDSDSLEDYSDAVNERIVELSEDQTKREHSISITLIVLETIVGLGCMAMGGIAPAVIGIAAECGLQAVDLLSNDGYNNCVFIEQVANFGESKGNGLVGMLGDQVRIQNSISAGAVAEYMIADEIDNNNVMYNLCIGEDYGYRADKTGNSSNVRDLCYTSTDKGLSSYATASGFKSKSSYTDLGFSTDLWDFDDLSTHYIASYKDNYYVKSE